MGIMDIIMGLFGGNQQTQPQTGAPTIQVPGTAVTGNTQPTTTTTPTVSAQPATQAVQQPVKQTSNAADTFGQGLMKSLSGRDSSGNLLQGADRQNFMAGRAIAGLMSDLGRNIGGDTFGGRLAQGAYSQIIGGLEAMNSAIQQDFLNGLMQAYLNGIKPTQNVTQQIADEANSIQKEANKDLKEDPTKPVSPSAEYLYDRERKLDDFYRGMGL